MPPTIFSFPPQATRSAMTTSASPSSAFDTSTFPPPPRTGGPTAAETVIPTFSVLPMRRSTWPSSWKRSGEQGDLPLIVKKRAADVVGDSQTDVCFFDKSRFGDLYEGGGYQNQDNTVREVAMVDVLQYDAANDGDEEEDSVDDTKMLLAHAQSAVVAQDLEDPLTHLLPWEIRLRIFQFLSLRDLAKCSCVCRAWNQVAKDGSLWAGVNLSSYAKKLNQEQLISLALKCGIFLRTLSARGCVQFNYDILAAFAAQCPRITTIDLTGCRSLPSSAVCLLLSQCTNLEHLNLSGVSCLEDGVLLCLARHNSQILTLDLTSCKAPLPLSDRTGMDPSASSSLTAVGLQTFISSCTVLTRLKVANCPAMNDTLIACLGNSQSLQELSVRGCLGVTDRGISALVSKAIKLKRLNLSGCKLLTDKTLRTIAKHLTCIERLELAYCSQLSDSGFECMARSCNFITHLDMEECFEVTDQTLFAFATHLPKLQSLYLSYCEKITNAGIFRLVEGCRKLRQLDIDNCTRISDAAVRSVISSLSSLRELAIYDSGCKQNFSNEKTNVRIQEFDRVLENQRRQQIIENEETSSAKSCTIL